MHVRVLCVPDTSRSGARPPTYRAQRTITTLLRGAAALAATHPSPRPALGLSTGASACARPLPTVSIPAHAHAHGMHGPPRTEADGPPGAEPASSRVPSRLRRPLSSDVSPVGPVIAFDRPSRPGPIGPCPAASVLLGGPPGASGQRTRTLPRSRMETRSPKMRRKEEGAARTPLGASPCKQETARCTGTPAAASAARGAYSKGPRTWPPAAHPPHSLCRSCEPRAPSGGHREWVLSARISEAGTAQGAPGTARPRPLSWARP